MNSLRNAAAILVFAASFISCSSSRSPYFQLKERDIKVEPAIHEILVLRYIKAYDDALILPIAEPLTIRVFQTSFYEPDILPKGSLAEGALGAISSRLINGRRIIDVLLHKDGTMHALVHELVHEGLYSIGDISGGYAPDPTNPSVYIHIKSPYWAKAKEITRRIGIEITGNASYMPEGKDLGESK